MEFAEDAEAGTDLMGADEFGESKHPKGEFRDVGEAVFQFCADDVDVAASAQSVLLPVDHGQTADQTRSSQGAWGNSDSPVSSRRWSGLRSATESIQVDARLVWFGFDVPLASRLAANWSASMIIGSSFASGGRST